MPLHLAYSLLTLLPGHAGGSESNVRGLLAEFARGNGPETVTVLANGRVMTAYRELAKGPVSLHHVRSYRVGEGALSRALAMALARAFPRRLAREVPEGIDVVHFPVTVPVPELPVPRVVTVYDLQHHELPELFSRAELSYRAWAYDGAARSAHTVVTTSGYSRERIAELRGGDASRIEVVPMGIDNDRFTPRATGSDERALATLGLPERFVVYPANLWPHKNHRLLVEAFAQVRDRELCLVLTGQAYGRLDALMAAARAAGVGDRVRHLGFVSGSALPAIYRGAQAMVFPSLYEGFGAPPLEAMACGCPVASSTRAALGEHVGDAVLELDPEDRESIASAIERIASDGDLRERLRAAGLKRAAGYTWARAAERHREIYASACETF